MRQRLLLWTIGGLLALVLVLLVRYGGGARLQLVGGPPATTETPAEQIESSCSTALDACRAYGEQQFTSPAYREQVWHSQCAAQYATCLTETSPADLETVAPDLEEPSPPS